jgi:predicted RNA-binding protein YlxR (DUF448 family)
VHGPAVIPDPQRKAPGRGAHLHPTLECLELALRRRAFARALRAEAGLSGTPVRDYLQQRADEQQS